MSLKIYFFAASASLLHSQFSGVSLLHNVLQLTGKLLTVDADRSSLQSAEQLNLLFQLLSNVAFNSECVSVIWKVSGIRLRFLLGRPKYFAE